MENRRVERRPGCTMHTGGVEASDVEAALAERDRRIAVLEAEIERLR